MPLHTVRIWVDPNQERCLLSIILTLIVFTVQLKERGEEKKGSGGALVGAGDSLTPEKLVLVSSFYQLKPTMVHCKVREYMYENGNLDDGSKGRLFISESIFGYLENRKKLLNRFIIDVHHLQWN